MSEPEEEHPQEWSPAQQLQFQFLLDTPVRDSEPAVLPEVSGEEDEDEEEDEEDTHQDEAPPLDFPKEAELTQLCRDLLQSLGIKEGVPLVHVEWNTRLTTTAGYASYPRWRIELNPRLAAHPGQVDRTLRHELAHLVAYHRAQRRRIEPHGAEWQRACADLGIPGESAKHRLPFPRRKQQPRYAYQCPHCQSVIYRVRPFRRDTACFTCCRDYAGGKFDRRFRFNRMVVVQNRG